MNASRETSLLRMRRTLEAAAFLSRGFGLVAASAVLAAQHERFYGQPAALRAVCVLALVLMLAANGISAVNFRRPDGRAYGVLSAVQVLVDTAAVLGFVIWGQGYSGQTTWPLLLIGITVGAFRHRLAGALTVWGVTSAIFVASMSLAPHPTLRPGEMVTAVSLGLITALICGLQGEAYARQVTELEQARRELHHRAHHDPLTGLANRDELEARATALDGRAMAVLLLDLDGFKQVNDSLGHAAGDRLLQEIGRRLAGSLREGDLAGRIGGDEFVILLPGAGRNAAEELAGRLRTEIRRPVTIDGEQVTAGTSIGIACRAAGEITGLASLTREADAAMYEEKAQTRR